MKQIQNIDHTMADFCNECTARVTYYSSTLQTCEDGGIKYNGIYYTQILRTRNEYLSHNL